MAMKTLDLSFMLVPASGETYLRGDLEEDTVGPMLAANCARAAALIERLGVTLDGAAESLGETAADDNICCYVDAMIDAARCLEAAGVEVEWPGGHRPSYDPPSYERSE